MISKSIVAPFMENYKLKEIKIQNTEVTREYYFVHHKSKFLTKSMKAFQEYMTARTEKVQEKYTKIRGQGKESQQILCKQRKVCYDDSYIKDIRLQCQKRTQIHVNSDDFPVYC